MYFFLLTLLQNDNHMLSIINNSNKSAGKENEPLNSEPSIIQVVDNMMRYLGKTKSKYEEELEMKNNSDISVYEIHLQRLEARIRDHIRVEQQLKLYSETLQQKLDDIQGKNFNEEWELKVEAVLKENTTLKKILAEKYFFEFF